jgi:hypothetical protein
MVKKEFSRILAKVKKIERLKIPSKEEIVRDDRDFIREAKSLSHMLKPIAKGKKIPIKKKPGNIPKQH